MRTPFHSPRAAALMLTLVASCGGQTDGSSNGMAATSNGGSSNDGRPFPFGVYSDCTWLLAANSFESSASSASLTLAPSGSFVVATFKSEGQPTAAFDLRATSDSSASLSASGQGFKGEWGFCGGGAEDLDGGGVAIADPAPTQAALSMSSAELTVDRGVVFVELTGTVVDVQGNAGCAPDGPPSGPASALLVCSASSASDGSSNGISAGDAGATATSSFVTGSYKCTSSVSTVVSYDGNHDDSSETGGAGTLTLTTDGSGLKAAYNGDTYASGTLRFTITSNRSANPVPGQTIDVACGGIDPTTPMSPNDPTVTHVSAGALTTDGTTLYLTFLGTVPSGTCSGQTSSTVLQCTPSDPVTDRDR